MKLGAQGGRVLITQSILTVSCGTHQPEAGWETEARFNPRHSSIESGCPEQRPNPVFHICTCLVSFLMPVPYPPTHSTPGITAASCFPLLRRAPTSGPLTSDSLLRIMCLTFNCNLEIKLLFNNLHQQAIRTKVQKQWVQTLQHHSR